MAEWTLLTGSNPIRMRCAVSDPPTPVEPTERDGTSEATEAPDTHASEQRVEKAPPKPRKGRARDPVVMRAYRARIPIDGTVENVIKGGYEVRIGKSRGFCPHSQIDLHRIDTPEEMVGKSFSFRVIQVRRGGDDVVLSRRAILEEERVEEAKSVRATLLEGAVMDGHVARLTDFGAFVDLGAGVTGLVHVTELAHTRVNSPSEVVKPGDRVSVRILKIDESTGKISLSIRQAVADPWDSAGELLRPGAIVEGTVLRLTDFGAFVQVRDGVEVLAPARECPPMEGGWRQALAEGTRRVWIVLASEPERHRATVIPWLGEGVGASPEHVIPGAVLTGKVQKTEGFGVFVWIGPGRVGFVPRAWTGVPPGSRIDSKFRIGDDVKVEVIDVEENGPRIRLGIEGVPRTDEAVPAARSGKSGKSEVRSDAAPSPESQGTFGTNLGEALRAALKKK